jgi:hypothetical protein
MFCQVAVRAGQLLLVRQVDLEGVQDAVLDGLALDLVGVHDVNVDRLQAVGVDDGLVRARRGSSGAGAATDGCLGGDGQGAALRAP